MKITMRTFIAIELPQEVKDTLGRIQDRLKASGADVKWVEPRNIHLTLKFLGETDEQTLNKVTAALEEIAKAQKQFSASLSFCDAFPSINSPRVIWQGITRGEQEIKAVAARIETRLAETGIPKEEHEFAAHITLGRTRSSRNRREMTELLTDMAAKPPQAEFAVTALTLFQSTLTPRGPVYTALRYFPLSP